MAEKLTAPGKEKKPKKGRKEVREFPTSGHNLVAMRKEMEPFVAQYLELKKSQDSDMAGYRSDFNNLYESGSEKLGLKKSVLTRELKRIAANKKAEEKEAEMAADERAQTELVRELLDGTPFGKWAAGELAKPKLEAVK